jgi:hypothetical protein
MASTPRLASAGFASSLTAFQASVSLSGMGLIAGNPSGGCAMVRLVGRTPKAVGRGIGWDIDFTPLSDAGLSGLGAEGDVWDEPERSVVDRLFSLRGRNRKGIILLAR